MFNRKNLEVAKLASKDNSRFAITAIQVTPEYTVATDGHILGKVSAISSSIDIPFTPFLVDAKQVDAVCRNTNGGTVSVREANRLHVESKIGPVDLDTIEHNDSTRFPNIDVVIPKIEDATLHVSFDPELLIRALTLFKGCPTVTLHLKDKDSCLRIDARTDEQTIMALVMPKNA